MCRDINARTAGGEDVACAAKKMQHAKERNAWANASARSHRDQGVDDVHFTGLEHIMHKLVKLLVEIAGEPAANRTEMC